MTKARIYRPSASSTQSGLARTCAWILEWATIDEARDPATGWNASGNTLKQVRLTFPTAEAALEYAHTHGIEADVLPDHARARTVRRYGDHFRYKPE